MDVRSRREVCLLILLTRLPPTPQVILDFSKEVDVELIDRVVNACFFGSGQEVGASFIAPCGHHSSSHNSNMQPNRP